jgi:hypothetical protein
VWLGDGEAPNGGAIEVSAEFTPIEPFSLSFNEDLELVPTLYHTAHRMAASTTVNITLRACGFLQGAISATMRLRFLTRRNVDVPSATAFQNNT